MHMHTICLPSLLAFNAAHHPSVSIYFAATCLLCLMPLGHPCVWCRLPTHCICCHLDALVFDTTQLPLVSPTFDADGAYVWSCLVAPMFCHPPLVLPFILSKNSPSKLYDSILFGVAACTLPIVHLPILTIQHLLLVIHLTIGHRLPARQVIFSICPSFTTIVLKTIPPLALKRIIYLSCISISLLIWQLS